VWGVASLRHDATTGKSLGPRRILSSEQQLLVPRHCEEHSDEAIQNLSADELDCFASLAMTHLPAMSVAVVVIVVVERPLEHGARPDRSRMGTTDGHPGINGLACSKGQ